MRDFRIKPARNTKRTYSTVIRTRRNSTKYSLHNQEKERVMIRKNWYSRSKD